MMQTRVIWASETKVHTPYKLFQISGLEEKVYEVYPKVKCSIKFSRIEDFTLTYTFIHLCCKS
jgi:hypothetical protein